MADFYLPAPEPKTELGRYRVLSSTAGIRVSPLCLGGMSIGAAWSGGLGAMTKEDAFALLDAFVEAGGNFIDTANIYQNEESEVWIGEWIKERKNRDQIVVATKYTSQYRAWELGKLHAVNYSGNSKRSLYTSVRDSLQKLQTEWIDILYLHWWDQTTSVNEIMDSLHTLVQQGKVLYLGISNAPAWAVAAANTYATMHGKTPFSVYQGQWNVMCRDLEREIIPMARHFGMALCPWNVMGGGRFQTSKQLEARKTAGEEVRRNSMGAPELTAAEVAMSQALEKVAAEHGIDSITSVAIAYVMAKAPCVYPLVGGRKTSHLEDNIQALSLHLTPKQIEYLESVQPFDLGYPHTLLGPDPKVTGQPTAQLAACSPIAFPKQL